MGLRRACALEKMYTLLWAAVCTILHVLGDSQENMEPRIHDLLSLGPIESRPPGTTEFMRLTVQVDELITENLRQYCGAWSRA